MVRYLRILTAVLLAAMTLAACSRAGSGNGGNAPAPAQSDQGPAAQVRLGYFPNITHAPALVGVAQGYFAKELGTTKLVTQQFNAGPPEVNAVLGNSLDAAFIGSSPAINAFAQGGGQTVRLVAGSTSGGAELVVRPGITSAAQLKGQIIADPQLGNTQDVSLKKWLKGQDLAIGKGPDAVTVQNLANPRILDLYKSGGIAGAWLPEPWSSQLVVSGGAVPLVDEKSLWPNGQFPTTVLIVRTDFLQAHPATVAALLRGEQQAIDFINTNTAAAKTITNDSIKQLTGSTLTQPVLDRAFSELSFGLDPIASTFPQLAKDSVTAGITSTVTPLPGFFDPTQLNKVLQAAGKPAVDTAGIDKAQG